MLKTNYSSEKTVVIAFICPQKNKKLHFKCNPGDDELQLPAGNMSFMNLPWYLAKLKRQYYTLYRANVRTL